MRNGGRISAAIEVLRDVLERHQPIKVAMRDWGKRARYAGSTDRAWVSGLVLDALRRRNSAAHHMGHGDARALVLGTLSIAWGWNARDIEQACYDDHGPTPLTNDERSRLIMAPDPAAPPHAQGDYPDWMTPYMQRVFGPDMVIEAQAMAVRADVDLRVNTLKSDAEKAALPLKSVKAEPSKLLVNAYHIPARDPMMREDVDLRVNTLKSDAEKAALPLKSVKAEPSKLLVNAYHIPARDPTMREDSIEGIPAFSKGWVEVQDAGSQIAAAAANARPDEQVMDYCAGGGGKTLALAAQMEGKGQIHAYDIDGKRLSALIPRLKRSGAQ